MTSFSPRLAVGIATRGRPKVLSETLMELRAQVRQPNAILVAYTTTSDIGDAPAHFPEISFLKSEPGLTTQRNTILKELHGFHFVSFLDDDFLLAPDYLAVIERVLVDYPDVAVATGNVLADGINGPGLGLVEALEILHAEPSVALPATFHKVFNAYGCNMTFRLDVVHGHQLVFDEQLPLYGWYEDVDFSRRVAAFGEVVQIHQAYGVHLGVKSGRQSGFRLGYSQVANPVYLARKESVSWFYAIASMTSRSLKNLVLSVHPEPLVDRRGRLRGNAQAWMDLVLGTLHPTRILMFEG